MRMIPTAVTLFGFGLLLADIESAPAVAGPNDRAEIAHLVSQIRRADYQGDRVTLKKAYDGLSTFLTNNEFAARVRYWRGFALWRSAINAGNDSVDVQEMEQEFRQAADEFKDALVKDPDFVDAKVGMISCLGYIAYFHRKDRERTQKLLDQIFPLVKEAKETAPDNPRLIWVLGPILWYTPADRGGGLDKVIENYERGIQVCSKIKAPDDTLEPSWGKPELMMSLAYTYLQKDPPDVNAAERNARGALEIVPDWHYLRDLLLPQIVAAKTKVP
jgi:tetratricopeptide (TPR) repeat protein